MELPGKRRTVQRMLTSPIFDTCMCALIIANSVIIGLEQSFRLQKRDTFVFEVLEHAFTAVYVVELGLRFYALRLGCLSSNWVRFDCVLVTMSVLSNWLLFPLVGGSEELGSLLVLRMTRLLRIARAVRLVTRFRELWMLVQGLLNSMGTLMHTLALCLLLLYIFGCVSIELIPLAFADGEATLSEGMRALVENNFSTLPVAMLTLVQFITFDNVVHIYRPLIEQEGSLAPFFVAALAVLGVVFMNLVTAILVNGGLEQAMQDKDLLKAMTEHRRKRVLKALKSVLVQADTDHSGKVSRWELEEVSEEDRVKLKSILGLDDLLPIFDCLDVKKDGDLAIDDFVEGIESIVISNTPVELKRIERMVDAILSQMRESREAQGDLKETLLQLSRAVAGPETSLAVPAAVAGAESALVEPAGLPEGDEAEPAHCSASLAERGARADGGPGSSPRATAPEPLPPGNGLASSAQAAAPQPLPPIPPDWVEHLVLRVREACAAELRSAAELALGARAEQACVEPQVVAIATPLECEGTRGRECGSLEDAPPANLWEVLPAPWEDSSDSSLSFGARRCPSPPASTTAAMGIHPVHAEEATAPGPSPRTAVPDGLPKTLRPVFLRPPLLRDEVSVHKQA